MTRAPLAVVPTASPSPQALVAERLASGNLELPVLPKLAQEVTLAASDPLRGAADVARLVERDPALCARVLRSANSVMYGTKIEIVSVRQAVARVGMGEVAALAMSAAVHTALVKPGAFQSALLQWWRSSLATGLFAKEIARMRRQAVDSAFLGGLLRRVGAPVVINAIKELAPLPADELDRVVAAYEVEAGLMLCEAWQLSAQVREVVAHCNTDATPSAHVDMVNTTRIAAEMSGTLLVHGLVDAAALHGTPAAVALNLYPDDLDRLAEFAGPIASAVEAMS